MRLCRFTHRGVSSEQASREARCGFYTPTHILPVDDLASAMGEKTIADAIRGGELERLLPINSAAWRALRDIANEAESNPAVSKSLRLNREDLQLLPPIARPPKLFLLAGNYAAHVEEQGGIAKSREQTFPYVFMKPPSTTLVGDRTTVAIPSVSPDHIDHEVELAVIIGQGGRHINSQDALDYVAGYTIINDLSDRKFTPNPNRELRPKDDFFDWLHGKWHDGFCPCGPCMVTPDEMSDPQQLHLSLAVDGEQRQSGSTAEQIFGVRDIIAFISSWVTLEPGDIISTGTPSGVGNASGKFLKPGQTLVAEIESIGTLTTPLA